MVVHVSTAYCYPGHAIVEETVGTPDIQWTHLVDNVKNWSSDMPTSITSRILVNNKSQLNEVIGFLWKLFEILGKTS